MRAICCSKIRALQRRDLRRIRFPAGGPRQGVGQVVAAQQKVVGVAACPASGVPAEGRLGQPCVLANPFDVLPQRRRQFGDGLERRLALTEEDVVEPPQPFRDVGFWQREPLDRDELNWDQPLAERGGMVNLPGAALGFHRGRGNDEDHRVGALDQGAEPGLPNPPRRQCRDGR